MNDRDYSDIINLPHHVSRKHKPMPMTDRGAQFSPFAALTGFGSMIVESGRRTGNDSDIVEDMQYLIDSSLRTISLRIDSAKCPEELPYVIVSYFEPDLRKSGGKIITVRGKAIKLDSQAMELSLDTGDVISVSSIREIEI